MNRPGRAKLSSGHVRTVGEGASPKLGVSEDAIVLGPATDTLAIKGLLFLIKAALAVVLIGATLYVALAVAVVVVMGSGDKNAIVVRGGFPGGIAAQGDFAFFSDGPTDRTLLGKLDQVFSNPGGSTVQIVALPGATLTAESDQIMADGKATGFYGVPPQARLGHEYLAVCVSGSVCTNGELYVLPDDRIVGQVHRFIGFKGLADPTTYRR